MKVTFYHDEDEVELELPSCKEVCPDCDGEGKTYLGWSASEQPAFTEEDFYEEGPDFREDYFSGAYDRTCPECKGLRVVDVINWELVNKADPMVKAYLAYREEEARDAAISEGERRMGA